MKSICFYFQVHQPFQYRRYRFFDIGNDHYYYDDYSNESALLKFAQYCYLPANQMMLELITRHKGKFKIAFSISGLALEQFQLYAPEVLDSFKTLADTGCVEFLSETYSHSLASLTNKELFIRQIQEHDQLIEKYFGQKPVVFRNTELIYSDEIGEIIDDLGFQAIITEGPRHILGRNSPNYLYTNAVAPRLKVLMRNFMLSDDIAFRFADKNWNEYPLTPKKFVGWLNTLKKEDFCNLFIDYETFGVNQSVETGIFEFMRQLPDTVFKNSKLTFATPSEIASGFLPVSQVSVPLPISWADEERDLSAWLGNDLQDEAYRVLNELSERMMHVTNLDLIKDWNYLQASDHFYYMCTKFFSAGEIRKKSNPYQSPYDAFLNYMNVLSDFKLRLDTLIPETDIEREIRDLKQLLVEKEDKLKKYEAEIKSLHLKRNMEQPDPVNKQNKQTK